MLLRWLSILKVEYILLVNFIIESLFYYTMIKINVKLNYF